MNADDDVARRARLADKAGGGERFVIFRYDNARREWRGTLDRPVPKGQKWSLAVKWMIMPPVSPDDYLTAFSIRLVSPRTNTPLALVNHTWDSAWYRRTVHVRLHRMNYVPLEGVDLNDIRDLVVVIEDLVGEARAPADGKHLHIALDFAIAETAE